MNELTLPARRLLFTPGPATTTNSVKTALITEDMSPRDQRFMAVIQRLRSRITRICGDEQLYATALFSCSGTGAVEAMLLAAARQSKKILILNNGAYGQRMIDIANAYQLNFEVLTCAALHPVDTNKLSQFLAQRPGEFAYIAVVHHETTTGVMNNIAALGAIAEDFEAQLIVDAMSSFAAIDIPMQTMNIALLASSANKNLQGMAGAAFVVCDKAVVATLAQQPTKTFYLDLIAELQAQEATGQGRFTLPVQILFALDQALNEFEQETLSKRRQRYQHNWSLLHSALQSLGYQFLLAEEDQGQLLLSVLEPDHPQFSFNELHLQLKQHSIDIYPGKLPGHKYFRLCTIGDLHPDDMHYFVRHLSQLTIPSKTLEEETL